MEAASFLSVHPSIFLKISLLSEVVYF